MRRIDELCGLAVVSVADSRRVGLVADVWIDAKQKRIAALEVARAGRLQKSVWLPYEAVALVGQVSVLVHPNRSAPQPSGKTRLTAGQKVISTAGSEVGWYTNALVDEPSGRVLAIEISHGYFEDVFCQRRWVREFSCGGQGIVIP